MKSFVSACFLSVVTSAVTIISVAPQAARAVTEAEAKALYNQRVYTVAGATAAQASADAYGLLANLANGGEKARLLVLQAQSLYFVGESSASRDVKLQVHYHGYSIANEAVKILGLQAVQNVPNSEIQKLKSRLTPEALQLLGWALYERGAHLGQWGQAKGVTESLGRWAELRESMQLIIQLGAEGVQNYGCDRILGRAYFMIPGMLGGSKQKADKFLSRAFAGTKDSSGKISKSGWTNVYYAEVLYSLNQEAKAKQILNDFIATAKADPAALDSESLPELAEAAKEAVRLLKSWQV